MGPFRPKWILHGELFLLSLIVIGSGGLSRARAEERPSPPVSQGETFFLPDRLSQISEIRKEERALQKTLRREAGIASRPYREYLLYQNSLHFAEWDRRLAEIRKKGEALEAGFRRSEEFHPYSGAPPLSFYDPTRFEPGSIPYPPFEIFLFRLFFLPILILILSLPLIAIARGSADLRRTARIDSHRPKIKRQPPKRPPTEMEREVPMKKAS